MLASLHKDSGEYHKAEFFHLQALDILQVVWEITNALHKHIKIVSWLIKTHYDLSELYIDMGRYDKAEIHYEQNMRITSQVYGERSPEFSFVLHRLANLYSTGGQYDKAEPLIIRSLEILRQIFGENHPGIASGLSSWWVRYTMK